MIRVLFPVLLAIMPPAVTTRDAGDAGVLRRSCEYLWKQQAPDGGWHSQTYGLLRSGQALTPFVLHALLGVPEAISAPPEGAVDRALGFLRRHIDEHGLLGVSDPELLEYPHYATAYALRCFVRAARPEDRERILRLRTYLAARQYAPARGFERKRPSFGGWGFGGDRGQGRAGHMDIAHTRRVLEALRESGVDDEEMYARACSFLGLLQKQAMHSSRQPGIRGTPVIDASSPWDGGFYFSSVVVDANKGLAADSAEAGPHFRSYATATCDGILALLAAGVPREDARVQHALTWLREHPELERPGGVPREHVIDWGASIRFYHLAVRAEAYAKLEEKGSWRTDIEGLLGKEQQDDGSFANAVGFLMKEDDPLVCTTLAVISLSH